MTVFTAKKSGCGTSLLKRNWLSAWWDARCAVRASVSIAEFLRYRVAGYQRQLLSHGLRMSIEVTLERGVLTLANLPPVSRIGENTDEHEWGTGQELARAREELRVALEMDRFAILKATGGGRRTADAGRRAQLVAELMPAMARAIRREAQASTPHPSDAINPYSYCIVDNVIVPPSLPPRSNVRRLHPPTRRPPTPPWSPK